MTKLHSPRRHHGGPPLLAVSLATTLAALLATGNTHAQVSLPNTVAFDIGTGIYTYSYSVVNNGPTFDLAIINVPVAPGSNLMNLTSPSGFDISFDPGVGIVSFLEDFDPGTLPIFSPSSTRGLFTFTSAVGPASVTFDALDAGGNTFTGTTISPAIPEPGILSLLGATLVAPALLARRRRKISDASLSTQPKN